MADARAASRVRMEGKDYVMADVYLRLTDSSFLTYRELART